MTILLVEESTDYTGQAVSDVKKVDFRSATGPATATILSSQFDVSNFDQLPTFVGGEYSDSLVIRIDLPNPRLEWSFWNFEKWTAGDEVLIEGSEANDYIENNRNSHKTINGGDGDDVISGGSPQGDRLLGGSGNDRISTSWGNHVNGGSGARDHLDVGFSFLNADIVFDLTANGGVWRGLGTAVKNVESITFRGGEGDDWVTGGRLADVLDGGDGDDKLYGGAGNDALSGGFGSDIVDGGFGDDIISGSNGQDAIDGGEGVDQVAYAIGGLEIIDYVIDLSDGGGGRDIGDGTTLSDVEVISFQGASRNAFIRGGAFNDLISGNYGDDKLIGGAGNDRLDGWIGTDVLRGGAGSDDLYFWLDGTGPDVVDGGAGIDTLHWSTYFSLADGISVDLAISSRSVTLSDGTTISDVERLVIESGSANDTITGGEFNDELVSRDGHDTLNGGAGDDIISGGDGDDVITGGFGTDELSGGDGANRFVYGAIEDSGRSTRADTVDFSVGYDILDLSLVDAITGEEGSAFDFIGSQAFSGKAGELRYVQKAADVAIVYGDTNGDSVPDIKIILESTPFLRDVDFAL